MNTNPPYHAPATTPIELDVADIQNIVLNPVAFPFARYCFYTFDNAAAGERSSPTLRRWSRTRCTIVRYRGPRSPRPSRGR